MVRSLGGSAYAAKLYSWEPMSELPKLGEIQAALASHDVQWSRTDLRSYLDALYLATWRILDLMPAPKDVFLQIFSRNDYSLPKLSIAPHRPSHTPRLGRRWGLGIRLCVESFKSRQCARPYVDVKSGTFAINGLCDIRGLPTTHRGNLDLDFCVEGALYAPYSTAIEAPVLPDEGRKGWLEFTMQEHNDAMREGIFLAVSQRTFASPAEFLEAARNAVESVFHSSQLAKCMSLRACSLVLHGETRARVALHKTYTEADAATHDLMTCTAERDLSSDAEHRVGATHVEVSIHHWHPDTKNFYAEVAAHLSTVLDRFLTSSPLSGLAAIEACIDEISRCCPVLLPLPFTVTFPINGQELAVTSIALCRNDPVAQDAWSITLAVPIHSSYTISMTDGATQDLRIEHIKLFSRFRLHTKSPILDSRDDSLDALATHISEVIIATLEQVSGNVTFDDGATVPKLLAESVLEIVRELTPGLDLTGSSLCTARDNDLDVAVVGSKNPRTSSDSPHAPELEAIPRDQDDLRVPFASADSLGDQFRDPHGVLASTEQYDLNEGAGTGSAMQYRIGGGSILLEKTGCAALTYSITTPKDIAISRIAFASPQHLVQRIAVMEAGTMSALFSLCAQLCEESPSLQSAGLSMSVPNAHLPLESRRAMQSPMIAMKALGGAVGGARSSQLDIFITLKHAFSAGLSCHRQGLLLPIDIWISLRSQEVQAMNEDDRTSARDEFWQIVHSMRDGLGATVDCEVFENIQACADTIALTLAGLYSQTDAIAWSEVQITTRIYDDPSHNAKSTFQASAKRTIPQPDWGQQPLAREVPDQTKARPKSRLSRHMSVDAVSAIDEVQTPGIGGEKIALDPDKEGSTTASYVHQDGTSSVSTAFHADATAMESGTSRIWRRGVVIALGSNMGDRIGEIEKACRAIDADPDMRIVDTSCLYESEPMYVEDQDRFINGVCEIETTLSPMDLLDRLQAIERGHGRVKLIEKGPRNIDLDILLFGDEVVSTERLTIPHALMHERAFVLKPVLDLQGFGDVHVPQSRQSLSSLLGRLEASSTKLDSITPLRSTSNFIRRNRHDRRTHVMSILNTTPDSFSDGGTYDVSSTSALADVAAAHIAAGATIIDIGGQSSRPNAPDVSAEEEINRVLPAIAAIRNLPEAAGIAISVDTYRAAVAEAAVNAGAHIINDISAGTLDPLMHKTVAELGCTYIMMHMRGTPSTMSSPEHCTYKNGVLSGIQDEVIDRINDAVAVGIRKWRIMIDPGIGFAKTSDQNVEILRQLSIRQMQRLNGVEYNRGLGSRLKRYPMLLGSSRKGFIGNVTGVKEPKDRLMGTAATVTAAVIAGADIVRVHDVAEMAQVVKMADAIYRFPQQAAGRQGKVTSASALKCEPKQSPWRSQRTDGR